jgi:ABC-type glycerol-3-phosphate transport system substrate-binding protein
MNIRKYFNIFILAVLVLPMLSGCGLKQGNTAAVKELQAPITLKYWRVFDGKDAFTEIINAYRKEHPNVNIEYKKLRYDEYEDALIEAWAEDRGPDIFSIHNSWISKYDSKISTMPESYKLPYVTKRNKKSGDVEAADYKQVKGVTPIDIRNNFAEVVYGDVVRGDKVMGLPLSVDSLALFYNRTMLDNAAITKVPTTWVEVKNAVKKLTLQDDSGNIVSAGIAMGSADNINRATDIVSLLMMQNGTQMVDSSGRAVRFHSSSPYADDKNYKPGMEALRFYTDFALPSKEVYNWNADMPEATEAFISGRLAMMLGYSYQLPLIKAQGAKLNLGVAPVPHINANGTDATGTQVNMASYWVETVSKKTEHENYAWDFLKFATSKDNVSKYLKSAKKPTALRSLVDSQLSDIDVGPFANQVLTARSWYKGRNALAAEEIFRDMISYVIEGKNTAEEAINFSAQRINQTL